MAWPARFIAQLGHRKIMDSGATYPPGLATRRAGCLADVDKMLPTVRERRIRTLSATGKATRRVPRWGHNE